MRPPARALLYPSPWRACIGAETRAHTLLAVLTKERKGRIGSSKNGAEDIKKHKWYRGLNWAALYNRTVSRPVLVTPTLTLSSTNPSPSRPTLPPLHRPTLRRPTLHRPTLHAAPCVADGSAVGGPN